MKLYLSAYKSQAASVLCSRSESWLEDGRRLQQPMETSNKFSLVVGAHLSVCFFVHLRLSQYARRWQSPRPPAIDWSNSPQWSGRDAPTAVRAWKAAVHFVGFPKESLTSSRRVLVTSKEKKPKKKNTKRFP